ncbi:MAG: hypothetical protein Q8K82_22165, partial [Gemmatimonadaceae bacterium]|nr:hypothetical protein [Gemmatimonadaceae bacterium]
MLPIAAVELGRTVVREAGSTLPVPPQHVTYSVTPEALAKRYGSVSPTHFGTVDITVSGNYSYNVRDLHYSTADGVRGMRFFPVSDDDAHPDDMQVHGEPGIDRLLRQTMRLSENEPIYALLSYIRPDEHSCDIFQLPATKKLQLGHQHLGAYLGHNRTSHVLPRTGDWKGKDPLHMKWNVDRYPANVHVLSLDGVPQATLNRNAQIVNSILAFYGKSPTDTQTLESRTIDINTTLQFYRDSIRHADYLDDLSWYTNCAVHVTIVINVFLNVPHNEDAFHDIFGADGGQLWRDFKTCYEEVNGRTFGPDDETRFEPLWKRSGISVDEIRPLTFREYNSFNVAKAEGWLDEYKGRTPLDSQTGLAWPLETVLDVVSRFLETYINVRDVGGITAAAAILFLRHQLKSRLGLSEDTYLDLVKPIVVKLMVADRLAEGKSCLEWQGNVTAKLQSLLTRAEGDALIEPVTHSVMGLVIKECVEDASKELLLSAQNEGDSLAYSVAWLREALEPELIRLNGLARSGRLRAGFFSSTSIIHQIAEGLHPRSRLVHVVPVCTLMDQNELAANPEPPSYEELEREPQRPQTCSAVPVRLPKRAQVLNMANSPGTSDSDAVLPGDRYAASDLPAYAQRTSGLQPATACGCGTKDTTTSLVYVLGKIAYDFRSESRLNSIKQKMGRDQQPENPKHLLAYLNRSPYDASAVEWILTIDGTPVYVVQPQGPFANETYRLLQSFLHDQLEENVERVSIPGTVTGVITLRSGTVVPVVCPEPRGMYSWTTAALVNAVCERNSPEEREGEDAEKKKAVTNFLDRVYYQFRNLGVTSAERAINFVATNAFEVGEIFG